jgi:cell division protein FtsA
MGKGQGNLITAIDVGSGKTCVVVAEFGETGPRYRGHGVADSRGTRKGVIVDLDKAVTSIQRAVEQAEAVAAVPVEHAVVGVGGCQVRGVNSRGGIALGARAREVGRDDVRSAVERARAVTLPPDRSVLHLLPQEFILDEQASIRDPLGMIGSRLEVKVHICTAATAQIQNVVAAVNRAGIMVDDQVFEPLAAADAVLRADERELGVCVADVGAGSTDIVVIHEGVVAHTGTVPLGGDHFTNDVAVGLRTPLADAEKIKKLFGCARVAAVAEENEIEVPAVGDRPSRLMPQRLLAEVLEPRARELLEFIGESLAHGGAVELCPAGLVLTGGGARLPQLADLAEEVLDRPARVAAPMPISGMPEGLAEPEFSAALGMISHAHRARLARGAEQQGITAKFKALFAKGRS